MLTAAKLVLPALVAALFVWGAAWCVVRTLRPQMADTAAVGGEPPRSSKAMAALAGLLFVCVLQLVFCHAAQANNPGVGLAQAMEWQFYGNTDARHYIDLAQYGYGTGGAFAEQELMIVFFPLFPALLRVVHLLVGGSYPLLGLAVQGPLFGAAAMSLYTLVCRRWDGKTAGLTLALLLVSPAAVFFAAPMTESLFLLVTVRYVLAMDREQWGRCTVLGVLAGLCRAPGGLLLGLTALQLIVRWRSGKRPGLPALAAMLAPAAGLGLYFGLNQAVYGCWNQYSVYQWEHWGQKLGLFTNTVRYHLDYMASWWEDNRKAAVGICLAAILCILLALGLLAASVRRLPAAWLGFGLAYLAVTMGATWLLSAPRYAVGLFCLPVALALLLQDRPRLTCGALAVQVMVSVVYTWQYLHGWPIY